jgi:hypothetical protein
MTAVRYESGSYTKGTMGIGIMNHLASAARRRGPGTYYSSKSCSTCARFCRTSWRVGRSVVLRWFEYVWDLEVVAMLRVVSWSDRWEVIAMRDGER